MSTVLCDISPLWQKPAFQQLWLCVISDSHIQISVVPHLLSVKPQWLCPVFRAQPRTHLGPEWKPQACFCTLLHCFFLSIALLHNLDTQWVQTHISDFSTYQYFCSLLWLMFCVQKILQAEIWKNLVLVLCISPLKDHRTALLDIQCLKQVL